MHEPVEEYSTMTQQFLINALARILNIDENLFHHIIKVCNNEIDVLCPQALLALHNMGIRGSYPIVLENKSVLFFDETTGHINEFIKSYILQNLELIQKHSPQMLTLMSSPLLGNVPY